MFKVGDLVRCIQPSVVTRYNLNRTTIYKVEDLDVESIWIRNTMVDDPNTLLRWSASRFVLAERSIPEMILSGDFDV